MLAVAVAHAKQVVRVHGFGRIALLVDGLVDVGAQDEAVLIYFWAVVREVAYPCCKGKLVHDVAWCRLLV